MDIGAPTRETLERIADDLGLALTADELESYERLAAKVLTSYRELDEMPPPLLPVAHDRDEGTPPAGRSAGNAWVWRGRIDGADDGPLAGWTFAVKDNIAVASWPMGAGSAILAGYVPEEDATVVTRLLDAGARIDGKAACEDLCFNGGSHTSVTGPVANPHDPTRMAGGSSSGPAVLVATGAVRAALGTDQGGSTRIPAAWCGIVGLKPSFGLVPYSGVLSVEPSLDHVGILARTTRDAADVLEVLAGPDGRDPRQRSAPAAQGNDARALEAAAGEIRVAMVEEAFAWPGISDDDVDALVRREVIRRFGDAVGHVEEISVPLHRRGRTIMNAVWTEGARRTLLVGRGEDATGDGHRMTSVLPAVQEGLRRRAGDLAPPVKFVLLIGAAMEAQDAGYHYAKAQNLRTGLTQLYDRALEDHDVLAMPTVPFTARPFPPRDAPPEDVVVAGLAGPNTSPFDLTGHPAVSVNAGFLDGLPVGLQLVARHGDEATLLRAASVFEARAEEPVAATP